MLPVIMIPDTHTQRFPPRFLLLILSTLTSDCLDLMVLDSEVQSLCFIISSPKVPQAAHSCRLVFFSRFQLLLRWCPWVCSNSAGLDSHHVHRPPRLFHHPSFPLPLRPTPPTCSLFYSDVLSSLFPTLRYDGD